MIDLANTLLPNLPESLNWVYGVVYIIEFLTFSVLLVSPIFILFLNKKRRL